MDDKHPDQGGTDKDQDLDAERSVADAAPTGDARVDDAIAGLSRLQGRPADEHVAILEEVHGRLRDILGELDETPESPSAATGSTGQGQP
jgi:hypothetical protein